MKENEVVTSQFVSSSGNQYYTPIEYEYSEENKCFIPKLGKKINRYEMIQASKPSCDINYIVKRALAGDATALNVKVPTYADVSEMPDNLNDLHNLNTNAINQFYQLDPNLRKAFNNNVDVFAASLENGTFNDVIANFVKSQEKTESSESEAN